MAQYACAAQPWDVVGWATLTQPWRRSPQKRERGGLTGERTRGDSPSEGRPGLPPPQQPGASGILTPPREKPGPAERACRDRSSD